MLAGGGLSRGRVLGEKKRERKRKKSSTRERDAAVQPRRSRGETSGCGAKTQQESRLQSL